MSEKILTDQTTFQKLTTFIAGCCGISLKFADIATFAQQIGMIVGCVLVCGQAFIFFRGLWRNRVKRRPSNDV